MPELLEEVANIGKSAAEEAARIAAGEVQEEAAGETQKIQEEVEGSAAGVTSPGMVIEEKMPLQTKAPSPSVSPSRSDLAIISSSSRPAPSDPPTLTGAGLDEEIRRIVVPLSLGDEEASVSADGAKDLVFFEPMVVGLKEL